MSKSTINQVAAWFASVAKRSDAEWMSATDLYADYRLWSVGEGDEPMSQWKWGNAMTQIGVVKRRRAKGMFYRMTTKLKDGDVVLGFLVDTYNRCWAKPTSKRISLLVECPYCGKVHSHGATAEAFERPYFGHRVPHCVTVQPNQGYHIMVAPPQVCTRRAFKSIMRGR